VTEPLPYGDARSVYLSVLSLQNFRNYIFMEAPFPSCGAVFIGENGAGKTNILEAIYLLCTGRSQRGAPRKTMIRRGASTACTKGVFRTNTGLPTSVQFGFCSDNKTHVKVDDRTSESVSEWFGMRRIVPFGPPDMLLVQGAPSERRRFMDLVLSQVDPEYLRNLVLYKKSLLARNTLLSARKTHQEIEVYEERMAQNGAYLVVRRAELFSQISEAFSSFYARISNENECASIVYRQSVGAEAGTFDACRNAISRALEQRRAVDAERTYTSVGPHRDDFSCTIEDRQVPHFASQGQCRALAISLRLCSMTFLEERGGKEGLLILVDDAFCELDTGRVSRIYPLIQDKGQLFVTSTSWHHLLTNGLPRFRVANGGVGAL